MSGSLLTDFNDLHQQSGLQALRSLLLNAVADAAAFPAPLSHGADKNKGSISRGEIVVEIADAGMGDLIPFHSEPETWVEYIPDEELLADRTSEPEKEDSYTFTIERCLGRFSLLEGDTKIWDSHKKKLMRKTAFVAMVGKKIADEWSDHAKRRMIDQDAVKRATADSDSQGVVGELAARFVMLEGTLESWDTHRRQRVKNVTIQENFAAHYDVWRKSDSKRMIWHEDLVFDPTQRCGSGCINMFDGLPLKPIQGTQQSLLEQCQGIADLLFQLCEENKDIYEWTLKWLALPLQQQGAKMASALLFHGRVQGAGKSLFFDVIMRMIYGRYSATLGQHQLESDYSDWKSQNLYTVFEEIFSGASRYANMGTVKHLVTGSTTRIEKKFMSGWEESNHINLVFLSNEIQPLPIEQNDRRFLVAWPNKELPQGIKEHAISDIDSANGIAAWYSYLLSIDLGDFHQNTQPPLTDSKKRIIRYGLSGWEVFLEEWIEGSIRNAPYTSCKTEQLYVAYKQWCAFRGEKALTMTKFITNITTERNIMKARCWHGRNHDRKQSMCVLVGQPEAGMSMEQWLTACIEKFTWAAKSDEDVPNVQY